ncbi:MAG TPA: deacylase, partial [Vicinamibacteria bacterium]|nr:deacylase [Vicinamibacteria bacterium]
MRDLLDHQRAPYQVLSHPAAFTAQDPGHPVHLPGREMARTVVIRHGGALSLAVLPAQSRVDLDRL